MVCWRLLLPCLLLGRLCAADYTPSTTTARPVPCPAGMHQCKISPKQKGFSCFLPEAVCDGDVSCLDASDEKGCTSCKGGSVLCPLVCARRCDGVAECDDDRDEAACPHCRAGAMLCQGRCVKACRDDGDRDCAWRCNGKSECQDGGDELRCYRCAEGVQDLSCGRRSAEHRAPGSPRAYHAVTCGRECDGVEQCPNGWDEKSCPAEDGDAAAPFRRPGWR
ncbi:LDL receptor repeat-containing protein egg-1-like [Thrips palmi]|uniref:LDL receptor repeat-containing protein egg-1-like n=1 Tax=Thrips palmi TaxID=161013 RepID=A0A6P9A635_THRPL|nr:LDL receptor repeat-containing protein egg-1-like [Thrips palmi]